MHKSVLNAIDAPRVSCPELDEAVVSHLDRQALGVSVPPSLLARADEVIGNAVAAARWPRSAATSVPPPARCYF